MIKDVTLSITFTPDDIDVLERIRARWGRAVDETGIIDHILSEYNMKTERGPSSDYSSER
jgi:hypothetical protein